MSSPTRLRNDDRGFTLVETVVAVFILTVALVALAELLAVSVRMHQIGRDSADAARLAQDKVEEMMKMNFATNVANRCGRLAGREHRQPLRRARQLRVHAALERCRRSDR